MLTGPNRLEADKRNLHRKQQAQDVECGVAGEQTMRVPVHQQQHKHVQRNQIDDKHIATPCGHHVEIGQSSHGGPKHRAAFHRLDPEVVGKLQSKNGDA